MAGMGPLTREQEADRILEMTRGDAEKAMQTLERQFAVLHNRSAVVLTLCGIVISTTGFSGRIIAGTNALAQRLIVAGVGLVLLSAVVVVSGVLHLYWLTQQPGTDSRAWVLHCLTYRDVKTNRFRIGIILLLIGLAAYVGSIAVMLLNPHTDGLPAR